MLLGHVLGRRAGDLDPSLGEERAGDQDEGEVDDGVQRVLEHLGDRVGRRDVVDEARAFYGFQIAIENIHSEMYSLLIDAYVKDNQEKNYLFKSIQNPANFAERLIAFACIEGIFFSGSFCSIY